MPQAVGLGRHDGGWGSKAMPLPPANPAGGK